MCEGAVGAMILPAVLILHWALAPGAADAGCNDLRHVENGRTFFRYGGLYVTFSCNPGFRIHGYRTSSCVSGHWVREPPLCVAPGCTGPIEVMHGSMTVSPDGSLVHFTCDKGFRLFGSPLLYCKGDHWNDSAPVCKESDIMSSYHLKQTPLYKPRQELNSGILPSQKSHFHTVSHSSRDAMEMLLKPKTFLIGDLAKGTPKQPEKKPPQKLRFHKATTQSRGEKVTITKLNQPKEPTRNTHPLAIPHQVLDSPTVLTTISPAVSSSKSTESVTMVTAMMNKQKMSGLLDQMFSPPPSLSDGGTPLTSTTHRPHKDLITHLPVVSKTSTTDPYMVLTSASLHSDGFSTSTAHEGALEVTSVGSQEALKKADVFDNIISLKIPQSLHVTHSERIPPPVTSPELSMSGNKSLTSLASPRPFTAGPPSFIIAVMRGDEAPPKRAPTARAEEDLLPRTEVPTAGTKLGPALHVMGSPYVTTTAAYLQYPAMTKAESEQTTEGEHSALPTPAHRLLVGNIDGQLNISGTNRVWPARVLTRSQKNRTAVTSIQIRKNMENPRTTGKQVPKSMAWSSPASPTPKIPGFPVRTRRPVCPYPPLPAHGTFYFHTIVSPGPSQYKHYIQYACYPGYTLANGDVYSYCLHDGQWSGATPMCIEVTPCSLNNGGCSQVCQVSHENRAECHCQPGFLLLQDHRTCRDLDECVEGLHQCQQVCENTLGSYRCSCIHGFQLSADRMSCSDVDECSGAVDRTGCVFGCVNTLGSFVCLCPPGHSLNPERHCEDTDECVENGGLGPCEGACVNTPGSFHCVCPDGYQLAGNGKTCISECPPGYRKQRSNAPAGNSTTEHCIDIDECKEMEQDHLDKCEWKCVNLPGTHHCICPRGYTQLPGGHRCRDVNECALKNGGCSHTCMNHRGGYKCACPKNYRLSPYNRRTCQPVNSSQRTNS